MTTLAQTDAELLRWHEQGFNERLVRKVMVRGIGGITLRKASRSGMRMTADGVRGHLQAIVQRKPQAMVRISGGGKGMRHIRAHLDYISRNGQLEVEDQNGERFNGRGDVAELALAWQHGGIPIAEVSARREAFNIILSMPVGTNAEALRQAARAFAQAEFGGHQYAMVLHTQDSDPGREPSPNPHVHLCVKARDDDGVRLNPRKDDLRRWRARFAQRLRERGIDAAASSRLERFQSERGQKQGVRHKLLRGEPFRARGADDVRRAERAKQKETAMLVRFASAAGVLARSPIATDRRLALELVDVCRRARSPALRQNREIGARRER
ncbi:relaxase/mobilization nuclease domain-containing protein [Duganella sp. HH101]|uniref:relaxase/mobilization nuclease domain-containing protein n=1 Tax=Duganella sp. HH101 TaxID=1781066 RepID=UPI000873905B|nr:hypothetical protein [Duganella sp. HH101]OFA00209.1 hypothetical protein DUGA2_50420 [Duganella sp. HH101]